MRCLLRKLLPPFPPNENEANPQKTISGFINEYLSPAWPLLALFLFVSLASAVIEASLMLAIGLAVDVLRGLQGASIPKDMLLAGTVLVIAVPALRAASGVLSSYVLAPNIEARSIWRAHQTVLLAKPTHFNESLPGRTAERVAEIGASMRLLAVQALDSLAFGIAYGVTTLALLAGMSTAFVPALLLWFCAYALLVARYAPRAALAGTEAAAARSAMVGRLADSYSNIETIKLFGGMPVEREYSRNYIGLRFEKLFRAQSLETRYDIALATINALLLLATATAGLSSWSDGSISLGETMAAIALAFRLSSMGNWFLNSASGLALTMGLIRDGMASVAVPSEEPGGQELPAISIGRGEIAIDSVRIVRRTDSVILGPFDIAIASGEKVGLCGPSGCGKSSLINALLRLDTLSRGRILVDGQQIDLYSVDSLRSQIAVAPQHIRLFHQTLRRNITYGVQDPDRPTLEVAIDRSGLRPLLQVGVNGQPAHHLDEDIGEDGANLSGGERQRVSLARALFKAAVRKCPIVILDEATSALDAETEGEIFDDLCSLPWRPTLIVVSHSDAVLKRMDRVIRLDVAPDLSR